MLGYFLVVNLIRSDAWMKRCMTALVLGCLLVAGYGVYENYFGRSAYYLAGYRNVWRYSRAGDLYLWQPHVLGEYLIMAIPFALAMLLTGEKRSGRFFAFMTLCAACACLVFTWSRGAWLGFMFAMFVFFLVYTRKR